MAECSFFEKKEPKKLSLIKVNNKSGGVLNRRFCCLCEVFKLCADSLTFYCKLSLFLRKYLVIKKSAAPKIAVNAISIEIVAGVETLYAYMVLY